jgi:transposase
LGHRADHRLDQRVSGDSDPLLWPGQELFGHDSPGLCVDSIRKTGSRLNESQAHSVPDILLSNEELIKAYKDQQKVERGFRFLKDPRFMASTLFLKSTERIMALMMVMTLCLLVYAALEHRIRQSLIQAQQIFPHQVGQPISNPTARWVFQFFAGIHVLVIGHMQTLILNMNQYHWLLLKLLGEPYEKIYSGDG